MNTKIFIFYVQWVGPTEHGASVDEFVAASAAAAVSALCSDARGVRLGKVDRNANLGREMKMMTNTVLKLGTTLYLLVLLVFFATHADAATVKFSGGGTCGVIDQANGIRLDNCLNKSGKTANDLHVTFSFTGLPNRTLDIANSFGCGIITTCRFGSDVKNGDTWEGLGGSTGTVSNPIIWDAADIGTVLVDLTKVKANGRWTFDGKPVPISGTMPLALAAFGMLLAMYLRKGTAVLA
jgi:hypothetical protein